MSYCLKMRQRCNGIADRSFAPRRVSKRMKFSEVVESP